MEKKTRAFGFFLLAFALALPLAYADSSSTGAITFHSGWNMISVPVDLKITMASVADTCGTAAYAWRMDPGGYVQTDTLEPGHGYWIKGTKDCHYQVGVTSKTSSLSSLFTGWNIVGAYSDTVSLSDVKNNCVITAGPWHYNPSINNYEYSSTLAPSQAYWIKVSSPCTLSANDQPPTPPNPPNSTNFFSSDPSMGPSGASVTVTEFADFQCPYCDIVHGRSTGGSQYDSIRGTEPKIIANYANTGKVRFTYHIMAFLGQESIDAANAALCVREVGGDTGFFAMQDKLFDNQASSENSGVFSKANLKAYASAIGYSSAQVADCINSGKYNSQVQQSNTDAGSMGVQGTPTFTVNGVQTASTDYATVKAAIDSALGSPSGTEPLSVSCPVESATAGVYYSSSASASGGSGGYTYSITGALPSGVTAAGASVSGTPTASSGSYFYTVLVTDGAGNTKSKSCYITISATADTTLPSISVSADPDSGNVYTVTAIASDASGISSITVYSAQGTFGDHEVFTSKTCSSSPCQFATGGSNQYVYYATATDASPNHNVATSGMKLFTITSGGNPPATADTTKPSISASADSDSGNVYTVTATASDASGISSITIYSAQGTLSSHGAFIPHTCTDAKTCTYATGGSNSYVYYATATDASSNHNVATSGVQTFTLPAPADTTPPSISVSADPDSGNVYTVTATASDASGISSITIYSAQGTFGDHEAFTSKTCSSSPCQFATGGSNQYVYYATATDASPNHNVATATMQLFTITSGVNPTATTDTTQPSISVSADPDSGNVYTVTATASDASGISSITIYSAQGTLGSHGAFTTKTCSSSPCQFATGGSNSYVYYATATDASEQHNTATTDMAAFAVPS